MAQAGIVELQGLIDRSTAAAGPSLRRNFELPDHALSARQLTNYWSDGHQQVALATVTAMGAPRVAPVGALLRGAVFYVPSERGAARVVHITRRPSVSFTHWISLRIAVIVHGMAQKVGPGVPEFEAVDGTYSGGDWWDKLRSAGDGVFLRIDPHRVFTWAADPRSFGA